MIKLHANYSNEIAKIKPMNGVGQPPLLGISDKMFSYLTEANIPFSRLHDVGGLYGGFIFVDIPNIFRDFSKDENLEESYDFSFTDILITNLIRAKVEPIFRLGVTIENYAAIKAYRIYPPEDFQKWANISSHIVSHYIDGWANGFHYPIRYWEVWNEPENEPYDVVDGKVVSNNQMWLGTKEEFFSLYEVTAKTLKSSFGDRISVGGYASCGFYAIDSNPTKYGFPTLKPIEDDDWVKRTDYFMTFFEEFFAHLKKTNAPIDFFSWHSYGDVKTNIKYANYCKERLTKFGYGDLQIMLNEWNSCPNEELRGSARAASETCAMMLSQQNAPTDILCYYDARVGSSVYGGLFNPLTHKPYPAYYSMKAFGILLGLGTQMECEITGSEDVYAVAAKQDDKKAVLLSNPNNKSVLIQTNLENFYGYLIDETHSLTKVEIHSENIEVEPYSSILLLNYEL